MRINFPLTHHALIESLTGWSLLFLLLATPPAASECLQELEGSMARVLDAEASGDDLKVTVAWDATTDLPSTATLNVLDPTGTVVETITVAPLAGEMTAELVPGALAYLTTYGLAYSIELPGVLTAPYFFHVGFDCTAGPADCGLELTGDLETNAVVIDPELAAVLDMLAIGGSPDALGEILRDRTELTGSVATLAWQLDELDTTIGLPKNRCSDIWSTTMSRSPESLRFTSDVEGTPWPNVQIENAHCEFGASIYALAQKLDGNIAHKLRGETQLGMSLRSWTATEWGSLVIDGDALGSSLSVRLPTLATCQPSCDGQIGHGICFEGHLAAAAKERLASQPAQIRANAFAYGLAEYWIDDEQIFSSLADIESDPASGEATATDTFTETAITPRATPSDARLVVSGYTSASADGDATLGTCAIAEVTNEFQMDAIAQAGCAVVPTTSAITRSPAARGFAAGNGGFYKTGGLLKRTWCP